ncbi:MAG: polysaccharide biosynthesis protein [Alphaproteobacteria bacterium]|nr:polysaccharide biosynthesis protein [Alphaproteobacteria bacterium]
MDQRIPDAVLRYRRPLVVLLHVAIWTAAYAGAFLVRFDGTIPPAYLDWVYAAWVLPLLGIRMLAYGHFGLFHGMWRYTGQRDLIDLARATGLSTAAYALLVLFLGLRSFPRSVLVVEFMLTIAMVGGIRFASRTLFEASARVGKKVARRVLIVGAGDAGETMLREILRSMAGEVQPVGFLDDNPLKRGMKIHGVPVLGPIEGGASIIADHDVSEVVIATPSATGRDMRRILEAVSVHGVAVRTVPGLDHLIDGRVTVNQLRHVEISDLLGRDPVELDIDRISDMVRNEVVLVTGAGGSIGSELCRQVARFRPRTLVLVEQAENSLYEIHRELGRRHESVEIVPRIADICDATRLDRVFAEFKPGLVIHAAAHKHVPMMEWNPTEAVKNNINGTRTVADLAHAHEARRFVMVSTDKAVNPTSVMGCTKRVAELYVQAQAQRSATRFVTVRFGNVLGSNGSVIPLFREQIAKGGPVTVTHPDMQRYFMTIPEASQLVLQAATMGNSGEVFILDMGEPVKIVTLAEDLIRLSGLQPHRDIEIQFVGARPGEKLFEELSVSAENADRTTHAKIYIGRGEPRQYEEIRGRIDRLLHGIDNRDAAEVRAALRAVVPEYRSPEDGLEPETNKVIPLR